VLANYLFSLTGSSEPWSKFVEKLRMVEQIPSVHGSKSMFRGERTSHQANLVT
jgi:hypothetical protein